jgi:hypothetical protein
MVRTAHPATSALIDRTTNKTHGHSVNGTRFQPDGSLFCPGSKYTPEQHYEAVAWFYALGNLERVEEKTGIPKRTLSDWRHSEWWSQIAMKIEEEQEQEIRAKNSLIISKAQDEIRDRLENGEEVIAKDGSLRRVKVKAKDAAVIGSISFDKNRVMMGKPTSVSASNSLEQTLQKFIDIAQKAREKNITPIEGEFSAEDGAATP